MSEPYVILPKFTIKIATDKELWMLYGLLLSKVDDNGVATFTSSNVATALGLSRQRLRTLLNKLIKIGLATNKQPSCNQVATNIVLDYQLIMRDEQPTSNQQATNKQPTKRTKRTTKFTPPTDAEVADYVSKMGYHFNPAQFVPFYQSKGWMIGKSPMKDWRASCRTWEIEWKKKYGDRYYYETKPTTTADNIASRAQSRDRLRTLATGVLSRNTDKLLNLYNGVGTDSDPREN